jgi:Interferon regulatory factor transcription factor
MMSLKASTVYMPAAVGDPLTRGPGRAFEDAAASAAAAAAAAVVNGNMRGGSFNVPTSVGVHPPGLVAERRERVLLRPWLENLIDSGTVPGLEWTDDAKTTFKVPWKHRSKKNWSLLHSCVFLVGSR